MRQEKTSRPIRPYPGYQAEDGEGNGGRIWDRPGPLPPLEVNAPKSRTWRPAPNAQPAALAKALHGLERSSRSDQSFPLKPWPEPERTPSPYPKKDWPPEVYAFDVEHPEHGALHWTACYQATQNNNPWCPYHQMSQGNAGWLPRPSGSWHKKRAEFKAWERSRCVFNQKSLEEIENKSLFYDAEIHVGCFAFCGPTSPFQPVEDEDEVPTMTYPDPTLLQDVHPLEPRPETPPDAHINDMDEYEAAAALLDLHGPIHVPDISEFFDCLPYSKSPDLTMDCDHDVLVDQKTPCESQNAALEETASQEEPPDLTLEIVTDASTVPMSEILKQPACPSCATMPHPDQPFCWATTTPPHKYGVFVGHEGSDVKIRYPPAQFHYPSQLIALRQRQMALRGMIDEGIDPSLVVSMANNNASFPSPTLEATGSPIDAEMAEANVLMMKATEYTETAIPFYIYPSPSIPVRVGKLSNEVVKAVCDSGAEANIICQTYVDKYKFNKLPTRMTFHGFGHTREYYEVIEEYVWIHKKKIKLALFVSPDDRMPSEMLLGMPFFIATGFHLNYATSDRMLSAKFSVEGTRFSISVVDVVKAREDGKVMRALFPTGSKLPKSSKN